MERSQDIIGNDCTASCDLKKEGFENSSLKSDNIVILDKTVEDTNCNLTLIKSKKNSSNDKQSPTSSVKDKTNVIDLHVGPNGLINGLEVDNRPGATLNHMLEKFPGSENQDVCTPSHTTQNLFCETSPVSVIGLHERTESHRPRTSANLNSGSSNAEASLVLGKISSETSKEQYASTSSSNEETEIKYVSYVSELQMPDIMRLIQKDLSEPYSIYTYRYFIHNWPKLCFLAMDGSTCVGAIVCKLDTHRKVVKRGYIAMLAVDEKYRKKKIGSNLVLKAIRAMVADDADEVVLETEITNRPALRLYENLGFVRDKRLFRYYLNGVDALRLKLWLR